MFPLKLPKIAPDWRAPEINEKRQSKTEQRNNEEIQTDFPEICYISSSINKEEILSKYVRIAAMSNH